ncbi:MAG: hypothetical protein ABI183_19730 [Polyangiaceae bacterium]
MLRSILFCGVVGAAFVGPMSEPSAEAFGGGAGGPGFMTSAKMDTPPFNTACTNPAPVGIAHMRTTYLNPDGKHSQFQAVAYMEAQSSAPITLDFSKHTTVDWTATYHLPNLGAVHNFEVTVTFSEGSTFIQTEAAGAMHIACGSSAMKPAADSPPDTSTAPGCASYNPATLSVQKKNGQFPVMSTGAFAQSLWFSKNEGDANVLLGIFQHFSNMCLVGGQMEAAALYVMNGEVSAKKENAWGGTCSTYDGKDMKLVNDATGWLVVSGGKVLGRYQTEADAMAVAEVAKKRSNDCLLGEKTEPKELVFHYLH